MSERPPGASQWRQGVGVGVGHIYTQGTVQGVHRSHPWFLDRNHGFRGTLSYRETLGSGVQKIAGSKPGAHAPQTRVIFC
jgi:hypothetical protein